MPWRQDPFVRFTRRAMFTALMLLVVLMVGVFGMMFTLISHYHDEAVRQEEGTRKGLAIVKELTDGNKAVLDQLKALTTGSADAVQRQRLSGRCSQWFLITEIRLLVREAGGTPISGSFIPLPNIEGLDCRTLLTEEINP